MSSTCDYGLPTDPKKSRMFGNFPLELLDRMPIELVSAIGGKIGPRPMTARTLFGPDSETKAKCTKDGIKRNRLE